MIKMELSVNQPFTISEGFEQIEEIFGAVSDNFSLKNEYLKQITSEKNQKKVLPYLIKGLSNLDNKVRIWVINALRIIKDPCAIKPLSILYENSNSFIRRTIMEALLEIGSPKLTPIFIEGLNDSDVGVRRYAATGLGESKVYSLIYLTLIRELDVM